MVYQDSQPLASPEPKGNSRFEILLKKVFSQKQKNISNTSSDLQKNKVLSPQQPHVPSDYKL